MAEIITDVLAPNKIQLSLSTLFIGRTLLYLPETGSTNEVARRLAEEGAPAGTVVVTDYQTAGRGRLGRPWYAPPYSSLLTSIVLRPAIDCTGMQQVTMACALAVADAIEAQCGLHVELKWPNDLVLGGAKLGGLLTELACTGGQADFVVVGIGLNANLEPAQLPGPLLMPAVSLSKVLGRPVDRTALLAAILNRVERRYLALQGGSSVHREWQGRLATIGQPTTVLAPEAIIAGVAEGVDADGALLLRLPDGSVQRIVTGDVVPGSGCRWRDHPASDMMCNSARTKQTRMGESEACDTQG